jgi:hypothetical protein
LKRKKKKTRPKIKPSKRPAEPSIAPQPLTIPVKIGDKLACALVDSGSQADIISSAFAFSLGLEYRRLISPVHADLGTDGNSTRLCVFASTSISVNNKSLPSRSFFIANSLPPGIDVILGVPWLADTDSAVSATKLFVVPESSGPAEEFYNFETGRFSLQPQQNFTDLGFSNDKMTDEDMHKFIVCATLANFEGLDDYVDYEPHNPLLDIDDDDDTQPDLSSEEAEEKIKLLVERFEHLFVEKLGKLPPHRPIDHHIELIDEEEKIRPRAIPIPLKYEKQWRAHVLNFVETGYWSRQALDSACAVFAVPKHDPSLGRFVVNLQARNKNTVKRLSPIPDMKAIRTRLALHLFRSKLDFKGAYEQIRLTDDSVPRSGFISPTGTYVSRVMQQGDRNAPDTIHRLCTLMFSRALGRFVDVFYDDVFVYSKTRRAHLRYLEIVFQTLDHYKFYLAKDKVELLQPSLKALGCIIDDEGVHVDDEQWDSIKNWPTPKNKKDILRFSGTVQWMGDHLPHLNEALSPLSRLTGNVPWDWTPACDYAFELIKSYVPQTLVPLDLSKLEDKSERLYIFSDASMLGCGSWIGQGPTRELARPHRYHSAKFNSAQRNYTTTDQELLGVLDACLKYRELIIGWDVVVVTDHQPLRTYWDQPPKLTRRHVRLWETLSQFSILWDFIPGRLNVLADSLSRLAELCAEDLALPLPPAQEPPPPLDDDAPFAEEPSARMVLAVLALQAATETNSGNAAIFVSPISLSSPASSSSNADSSSVEPDSNSADPTRLTITSLPSFLRTSIISSLESDPLAKKILQNPSAFESFFFADSLLFRLDNDVPKLYIPKGTLEQDDIIEGEVSPSIVEFVVNQAHSVLGHMGSSKTLQLIRRTYWWPSMHKDVFDFVKSCESCRRNKSSTSKPFGLLHPLATPSRPWESASMDFVVGLPPVLLNGNLVDSILTVTCLFSKMVVLIPLSSTSTAETVAGLYHDYVYRRFGLQASLVSDRDSKFTSRFWRAYHSLLDTKIRLSSSAHPQTDGRSEVTNKLVGQILRTTCEDEPEDWANKLSLTEFGINSAASIATGLAPFEIVYGFLPATWPILSFSPSPLCDDDVSTRAERARLDWLRVSDALIASRVDMVHHGNKRRRPDSPSFEVGADVYVSSAGMRFPHSRSGKFIPKFVGPYKILKVDSAKSTVDVDFPPHLQVHPRIHTSKLRPSFANDNSRFPSRSLSLPPPEIAAGDGADEWLLEKIVDDRTRYGKREFKVRYLGYSPAKDEYRPELELKETAPELLASYLALVEARRKTKPSGKKGKKKTIASVIAGISFRQFPSFNSISRRSRS